MAAHKQTMAVLTSGTRGDIQPLIALADGFQQAGYQSHLITHASFRASVAERGISFGELDGDLMALLTAPERSAALIYTGNLVSTVAQSLSYLRAARPLYARMLASAWQQTQAADALIATLPMAAFAGHIAAARGIPYTLAFLQPIGATRHFPSPMLPVTYSLGPFNRLSHLAIELSLWLPWRAELVAWSRHLPGGAGFPCAGPFSEPITRNAPRLYGFSPHVVQRPADWPVSWTISGYWPLAHPFGSQLPADLQQFLARGPAPIYVGLGSMASGREAQLLQMVTEVSAYTGRRVVVQVPDGHPRVPGGEAIHTIGPIWHDLLLPRMALAVHHGGAGTTAAALRAGIPSVILPVGIDQFYWGQRVAALGCGPQPVAQRQIDAKQLAQLIQAADTPTIRNQARIMGATLAAEDGVGHAVRAWQEVYGG